ERACRKIARWMYDAGISFNAVKHDSFHAMIEASQLGMKPYHEVRVPSLKKQLEHSKNMMNEPKVDWAKYGCSVMSDGGTDKSAYFTATCPRGTMFVDSVDASSFSKNDDKMFEMLDNFVQCIGPKNVILAVIDSASSNVMAGRLLVAKYHHLYWTPIPCAAYCMDLMLENIGKVNNTMRTLRRAITLNSYIYTRLGVLNTRRKFTGQEELLRPAKTRFATTFFTLASVHWQKENSRKVVDVSMFKWAKDVLGKKVTSIILIPSFWNSIMFCLKVASPLRVLRLVDGEKKPPIGYVYEAMNRVKEAIMKDFSRNEEKYREIFAIIDRMWEVQLHLPLHAAGYFLNPKFYNTNKNVDSDFEVQDGLLKCIQRFVPSTDVQDKITDKLTIYKRTESLFGIPMAIRPRTSKGPSTPNLQLFAMKVISLTCSALGCERNWSIFEHLHSKKRNRLAQQKLSDLVYIKYNRALKRRYKIRDTVDPISLKDMDDINEWLIGRTEEEDEDTDNDFVFDDTDGLLELQR
ncbi:LOW QUALITY PROTEIN: DUF659 domain-containing protein/Dimer_Tnp_hAT domain-containing protein, partial [Cephalotus follicularis]